MKLFDIWPKSFYGFPEWKSVGHLRSLHSLCIRRQLEEAEEGALIAVKRAALPVQATATHATKPRGMLEKPSGNSCVVWNL